MYKKFKPIARSTIKSQNVENRENEEDDIFAIPHSQPEASQYLSQRNQALRAKASQQTFTQQGKNYFETLLLNTGVDFSKPYSCSLNSDQITFSRKLRGFLKSTPETSQKFIDSFKSSFTLVGDKAVENSRYLMGCWILNNVVPKNCLSSIIRILLSIDVIQKDIALIVLEKLREFILHDDKIDLQKLDLILVQFKFTNQTFTDEMYEHVMETFEVSSQSARQRICESFLDILDPMMHDMAAKKIIDIYLDNNEDLLTPATINTFSNMKLNEDTMEVINNKIMALFRAGASTSLYPTIVKFMLIDTNKSAEQLKRVIVILRLYLLWEDSTDSRDSEEIESSKIAVFEFITQSLRHSKILVDSWYKTIQKNCSEDDQKPIDLIVLLIIASIREDKFVQINSMFKQLLRQRCFNYEFMVKIFKDYPQQVESVLGPLLELITNMFKDKCPEICNFASTCFELLFQIPKCNKQMIISQLISFICEKSNAGPFSNHSDYKTNSLRILNNVRKSENVWDLMACLGQLLNMLDYTNNDLTMSQFRLMSEFFSSMAYNDKTANLANPQHLETISTLREHLDMMLKKQLGSSVIKIKQKGVIGVVKLVRSMMLHEGTSSDFSNESKGGSSNLLPDGPIRVAGEYIERLFVSVENHTECIGLAYDELSREFSPKVSNYWHFDKQFLIWLAETISDRFVHGFTISLDTASFIDPPVCPISPQFQLNESVSNGRQCFVNLLGEIFASDMLPSESPVLLPPLFKLMRNLYQILEDRQVHTILGCAVYLPNDFQKDNLHPFADFDEPIAIAILDCYFYCANFFREIIGAFVLPLELDQSHPSKDQEKESYNELMRSLVIKRLIHLVEIEKKIAEMLSKISGFNYCPPTVDFTNKNLNVELIQPFIKPKKAEKPMRPPATKRVKKAKGKNTTENDDTILPNVSIAPVQAATIKVKPMSFNALPKDLFRSLDPDIITTLIKGIDLKSNLSERPVDKLTLTELRFILDDMVYKVELSMLAAGKKNVMNNQNTYLHPKTLVIHLDHIFPSLMEILVDLDEQLKEIKENAIAQNILDPLFTDDINLRKNCFALIFRILCGIFKWPEFMKNPEENELLRMTLASLVNGNSQRTITELASELHQKFLDMEDHLLDVDGAVYFLMLVDLMNDFKNLEESQVEEDEDKMLSNLCGRMLNKHWFNCHGLPEHGSNFNQFLDELIKSYVSKSDLKSLNKLVMEFWDDAENMKTKADKMNEFPCFNRLNCIFVYRAYIAKLLSIMEETMKQNGKLSIQEWQKAIDLMNRLLQIAEKLKLPNVYGVFVRNAQNFLRIFLLHGVKSIDTILGSYPDKASDLIKKMQFINRFLHNLCCRSRKSKNHVIIPQIPQIRKQLEEFIHKVKAMMAANNCKKLFAMENLKFLDEEFDSQATNASELEDPENDDAEDVSDNEEHLEDISENQLDVSLNKSASSCM